MYYVYRYMHPDIPYLYIGKTVNLVDRIYTHDYDKRDNIDRQYAKLLQDSVVLYMEFNSYPEMTFVETYLIAKHKPLLNKQSKCENECELTTTIPDWQVFFRSRDIKRFNENFNKVVCDGYEELSMIRSQVDKIQKSFDVKIKEMQKSFDVKIKEMQKSFDEKISELENQSRKISEMEEKIHTTESMISASDIVRSFFYDCCSFDGGKTHRRDVYKKFFEWSMKNCNEGTSFSKTFVFRELRDIKGVYEATYRTFNFSVN